MKSSSKSDGISSKLTCLAVSDAPYSNEFDSCRGWLLTIGFVHQKERRRPFSLLPSTLLLFLPPSLSSISMNRENVEAGLPGAGVPEQRLTGWNRFVDLCSSFPPRVLLSPRRSFADSLFLFQTRRINWNIRSPEIGSSHEALKNHRQFDSPSSPFFLPLLTLPPFLSRQSSPPPESSSEPSSSSSSPWVSLLRSTRSPSLVKTELQTFL